MDTIFNEISGIKIPKRSSFYSLEPIGIGTAYVESATSYIARLAHAHQVRTRTFIQNLGLGVNLQADLYQGWYTSYAPGINGFGKVAEDYVQILENKTLRTDLKKTTLLPLGEVLTWQLLLRKNAAWCTCCLQTWSQDIIYYPLLWAFENYKVCHKHKLWLCDKCPDCGYKLAVLERRAPPGYCQKCKNWLGKKIINGTPETNDWDIFCSNSIAELIENMTKFKQLDRKIIFRNYQRYIDEFFLGNYKDFSKHYNIPNTTIWSWTHNTTPQLAEMLRFCYNTGQSFVDFVSKKIKAKSLGDLKQSKDRQMVRKSHGPLLQNKKIIIEKELKKVLLEEPISLDELKQKIGVSKRTLYRVFPKLTKKISKRYHANKMMAAQQKREKEYEIIRPIIRHLLITGEKPCRINVKKYLQRPPKVREKWIQEEIVKIRKEQNV